MSTAKLTSVFAIVAALLALPIAAVTSVSAGTLDDVRARGKLVCGVSEGLPGFSEKDGSGTWRGFDVDFCKAVAAAGVTLRKSSMCRFRPKPASRR